MQIEQKHPAREGVQCAYQKLLGRSAINCVGIHH